MLPGLNQFAQPWRVTEIGQGRVTQTPEFISLVLPPCSASAYSDAQITDYNAQREFHWKPPLRLTVRARAEPGGDNNPRDLRGTAGFGFWNHPFVPGERGFRLPQAAWFFFSSPPSNMQLAKGVPGPGWKAATIDASRWSFLALAPTAPLGFLLMRVPALYRRLWPLGQRAIGVSEHLLDTRLLAETHTYILDWQPDGVTFVVDDRLVHHSPHAPGGPLGFVAWIDNQYAVVTPQGHFGFGLLDVPHQQSLILETVILT